MDADFLVKSRNHSSTQPNGDSEYSRNKVPFIIGKPLFLSYDDGFRLFV